jgi:type III secretion protein L
MDSPIPEQGRARLLRDGKLIRREDAACWHTGTQFVEQANREAAAIRSEALEQAEEERRRGYAAGIDAANVERAGIIADALAHRDAYLAAVEPELIGVVLNAVRKIFAEFDEPARVRIVVGKALKTLREQTHATVRVHPSEFEALQASAALLASQYPSLQMLSVESDARIEAGRCVLSTDVGIVETDIESQIREIENAFARSATAARPAGKPRL